MPLRQYADYLSTVLIRFGEIAAALLLGSVVVINGVAVFYRYVLNSPIGWSEEILRYLVIWSAYLAAGALLRAGEHFTLELMGNFVTGRVASFLDCLIYLSVGAFCLTVTVLGFEYALGNWGQVSPVLQIPMTWPTLAIPVGCAIMALESFLLLFASASDVINPRKMKPQ